MESTFSEIQSGALTSYSSPPSQLGNAINPKAMEQQAYTNLLSILIVLHFNRFVYLLKSTTG